MKMEMNDTWTNVSSNTNDLWKSPRGTIIRIEILVILAAIVLFLLVAFGSQRRKSRSFLIQKGILVCFTSSSSLVTYTLGSMQSSAVKSSMYPLWAISLYILFGCADSITAYNLNDNDGQLIRQLFQCLLYTSYAFIITVTITSSFGYFLVWCLAVIAYIKVAQRLYASRLASESWNLNKMVADFMYQEHNKNGSSYDPATMRGYHYLVDWPLGESKMEASTLYAIELTADAAQVIDIERIWSCNDMSITQELKDTCLSFSLFHLLRRRFFGFACVESSQQKTHDFVFKGLLLKDKNGAIDCNKVFKVIDLELAFMYDFFFTKYAILFYGSKKVSIVWSLASASLISLMAYLTCSHVGVIYSKLSISLNTTTVDVGITVVILLCISLIEVVQLLLYWTSIWGRVSFVCQYIREQTLNTRGSCSIRLKEILTKIGVPRSTSNKHYYQDKLGQYSLLESVVYNPNPSRGTAKFIIRQIAKFMFLVDAITFVPHSDPRASSVLDELGESIKLSAEIKNALIQFLERSQGILTNGESSLLSNRACHLLWACSHLDSDTICLKEKENQSHHILTWHIATCYCEMAANADSSANKGKEVDLHFGVATKLSKYCAYLLISAPKLLPGHHYDTRRVFDAVRGEAGQFLHATQDICDAMKRLPESTDTIFQSGVKLGRQLQEMENGGRWKVLADFWTELLLYVAPSDNVKEHVECLANGGEFITHLWALLSHAGILDRGHQRRNAGDIENAGTHQPSPGNLSYGAALRLWKVGPYLDRYREGVAFSAGATINQPTTMCASNRDDGTATDKSGAKHERNFQCMHCSRWDRSD